MSEQSLCEIAEVVESTQPKTLFDKIVVRALSAMIAVTSLAMTCVLAGAAASRRVFEINFSGYDEIAIVIGFWLYFMGAAYGAYNNTHVSADVVDAYFPESTTKRILTFLRCLITVCVCGLFTYYGFGFFEFGFVGPLGNYTFKPTSMVWRIPLWTSYLAIFAGLILMEIYFLRNLVLSVMALFGRKDA